ncbi:MAG: U32 family peptidase [Hyphomicrobiaceae bacterium]|nr:U32 family peptidase [Hyphomicrobiaceae bacterium]
MGITLGPVLFNWQPDAWRDFYARIADEAPVDTVCLGEVVCSKRMPFFAELMGEAIERLERAGKSVVLSTLAMPTLSRERRLMKDLVAGFDRVIEANDMSILAQLAGRPHMIGPFINAYNETTLAYMARRGATSICLPPELPLGSIQTIAAAAEGVAVEVFAWGRSPLAISARCYHARVHGLTKDACQFVCGEDPDGLDVDTLDGQAFLTINGVQTLARSYTCLIGDVPQLLEAGITGLRLSPHTCDMVAVSRLYRDVADGRCEPQAAMEKLRLALPEVTFSNGFLHGVAGVALTGS